MILCFKTIDMWVVPKVLCYIHYLGFMNRNVAPQRSIMRLCMYYSIKCRGSDIFNTLQCLYIRTDGAASRQLLVSAHAGTV